LFLLRLIGTTFGLFVGHAEGIHEASLDLVCGTAAISTAKENVPSIAAS
jgi:hypothetical protein